MSSTLQNLPIGLLRDLQAQAVILLWRLLRRTEPLGLGASAIIYVLDLQTFLQLACSMQVITLRSLFTYVRVLPAFKMYKDCKVRLASWN